MQRRTFVTGAAAAAVSAPALVFAQTPTIGLSLPLTGVQADAANELKAGFEAGAGKAGLAIKVLDDAFKPERTAENIAVLAADSSIFVLSGIVGTPNAQKGIPVARAAGLPVVGLRSGSELLRDGKDGVFHLRTSFNKELDKVGPLCVGSLIGRMSIIYSDDSFGKSSLEYLTANLVKAGITVVASVAVDREGKNMDEATRKVANALKLPGEGGAGVFMLLVAKPMVTAAKLLRDREKIISPLFAMSFVANRAVCEEKDASLSGLALFSAFPLPRSQVQIVTRAFAQDMAQIKRSDLVQSLAAFEGWFYASAICDAYRKGLTSREAILRKFSHMGVAVADQRLDFDQQYVGYRYLQLLHKGSDGRLHA
jgi:branched-chain amino acid transport system substrate-binding protein